ncbi:hypothetical protein ACHAXS_005077 [Conticribra weissflogii]
MFCRQKFSRASSLSTHDDNMICDDTCQGNTIELSCKIVIKAESADMRCTGTNEVIVEKVHLTRHQMQLNR